MGITVLVVDDVVQFRSLATHILLRMGYQSLQAEDGREGFEIAKSHLPDLIISDCLMPHANGYDLLQKLKNEPTTAHIPFLMTFGSSFQIRYREGYQWTEDAYLVMPYKIQEFMKTVKTLLEQKGLI